MENEGENSSTLFARYNTIIIYPISKHTLFLALSGGHVRVCELQLYENTIKIIQDR